MPTGVQAEALLAGVPLGGARLKLEAEARLVPDYLRVVTGLDDIGLARSKILLCPTVSYRCRLRA